MRLLRKIKEDTEQDFYEVLTSPVLKQCVIETLTEWEPQLFDPITITDNQKHFFEQAKRSAFIVSYVPQDTLIKMLPQLDYVEHFALCTHNKDITPEGELKKPHTHILLIFRSLQRLIRVVSDFHTTEMRGIGSDDYTNEWNYLIHDSDSCRKANKVLYNPSDRVCDDIDFFESHIGTSKSDPLKAYNMVSEFLEFKSHQYMLKKYGFLYLQYYKVLECISVSDERRFGGKDNE